MGDSDKLGLGLDEIIRNDRAGNRRGGGGNRGFRGRTGRGGGNTFRTRGGGGVVSTLGHSFQSILFGTFSLGHRMHQQEQVVGNMTCMKTMVIKIEEHNNEMLV